MEKPPHGYSISRPQILQPPAELPQSSVPGPPLNGPRPLSDIRELSEPSVIDNVVQSPANTFHPKPGASRSNSLRRKKSVSRTGSARTAQQIARPVHARSHSVDNGSSSYSSTPEPPSFYTIPQSSVTRRSSSQKHAQGPVRAHARKPSIRAAPPPPNPKFEGFTIPNRGQSRSPVKDARLRADAVKSDAGRRVPSRTVIRTPHPADILEFPSYRHPRVKLELQVSAPLFVGGGSVEGQVKVVVDENERLRSRRSLGIGAISVDLLGFEDMPGGRKGTFLAVGTELIDTNHPPPSNMVQPANPLAPNEKFWMLSPSTSTLPFMISLPLDTGPPPFQSKNASIRFLLCATALVSDAGKHYRVRVSQDVCVLPTYDPEKALTSLPSPLSATDELSLPHFGRCESVRLTAGLHRQVWVSGSSIFVDVHISNKSHKHVKRLDLTLERDILCYKHAPAGTREKSASQARIFESNEQAMIARSSLKQGLQGWKGVEPHDSETRTCELELPRGHATVRCGKYFEVRFFLNITASLSNSKLVSVQLPITLIHINSLDVLPNSVAQVAAAIMEKRAQSQHHRTRSKALQRMHSRQRSVSSPAAMADLRRRPSYSQGRAFAAPRQQSIDRQRAAETDIDNLQQTLDSSPRKYEPQLHGAVIKKMGSNMSVGAVSLTKREAKDGNPFTVMTYHTPPAPTNRPNRNAERGKKTTVGNDHDLLKRMQSLDSIPSKKSFLTTTTKKGKAENQKPRHNFTIVQNRIEPYTLGLSTSSQQPGFNEGNEPFARPATGLSLRDKLDRSRFEFKAVRRKASGSVKERGLNWLDQMKHKHKEREGWI